MKQEQRLRYLLSHRRIAGARTVDCEGRRIKLYSVDLVDDSQFPQPVRPIDDGDFLAYALSHPGVEVVGETGVAIASPSVVDDYARFMSINMWKQRDGKNTNVPQNYLFGRRPNGPSVPFPQTGDNICTTELRIMGEEALMWERYLAGLTDMDTYLTSFSNPFWMDNMLLGEQAEHSSPQD